MKDTVIRIGILGISVLILYCPVFLKLVIDWYNDPNYSHGFLIPLIVAYFVWQKKDKLQGIAIEPSNIGLITLIGGLFLYIVANIGGELFTMRFSMIVVIGSLLLYLGGKELIREMLFPLAYLIFMIPIPYIIYNAIAFPMKLFASRCAVFLINMAGITVLREGNIIYLANATLEVADACSGLRSLISLLALSAAYAYLMQRSQIKKWVLFLSAVPVAVVANILRVAGTGYLAHFFGEKVAQGFMHEVSGMMVFVVGFSMLFGIGEMLNRISKKIPEQNGVINDKGK